jgi:hypothetical protein
MLNAFSKFTFIVTLVYIGLIVLLPDIFAPAILPDMENNYIIDGWVIFSRDKLGHIFISGLAALILNVLLKAKRVSVRGYSFLLGSVIIAVIFTLEEFRQIPLADRHFEMFDMFYNFAGILIFGRVGEWLAKKNWL